MPPPHLKFVQAAADFLPKIRKCPPGPLSTFLSQYRNKSNLAIKSRPSLTIRKFSNTRMTYAKPPRTSPRREREIKPQTRTERPRSWNYEGDHFLARVRNAYHDTTTTRFMNQQILLMNVVDKAKSHRTAANYPDPLPKAPIKQRIVKDEKYRFRDSTRLKNERRTYAAAISKQPSIYNIRRSAKFVQRPIQRTYDEVVSHDLFTIPSYKLSSGNKNRK